MKNTLGKLLLISLLLFGFSLYGTESQYCTYNLWSSKQNIQVNEPISISFSTIQKVHNEVIFFDLTPHKSQDYEIINIKEKRHEFDYHNAKKDFEFLFFAKKSGQISVKFDFQIRRASDDAVKQAYVGSRDNVKSIPTLKVHIGTPTLKFNVSSLKKDTDAVGNFKLSMSLDKNESNSYDALNVVYRIKGTGYLNKEYEPFQKIEGVSIFKGIKEQTPRATKNGYIYNKEWSYALVSNKNITIPKVSLHTYNPTSGKYNLKEQNATVVKINVLDIASLVDEEESPQSGFNYKQYLAYIYNTLIFAAGFLLAKTLPYLTQRTSKKEHCCMQIAQAKNAKELLMYSMKYVTQVNITKEIEALEELQYRGESNRSLSTLKAAIIQKIKERL